MARETGKSIFLQFSKILDRQEWANSVDPVLTKHEQLRLGSALCAILSHGCLTKSIFLSQIFFVYKICLFRIINASNFSMKKVVLTSVLKLACRKA